MSFVLNQVQHVVEDDSGDEFRWDMDPTSQEKVQNVPRMFGRIKRFPAIQFPFLPNKLFIQILEQIINQERMTLFIKVNQSESSNPV